MKLLVSLTAFFALALLILFSQNAQAADPSVYATRTVDQICSGSPDIVSQWACKRYLHYRLEQGMNKQQAQDACLQQACYQTRMPGRARHTCRTECVKMAMEDN